MSQLPLIPLSEPHSGNEAIRPCLGVLMPVYNEEATVERVIRTVLSQRPVQELIVVDDCSKDGTVVVLERLVREEPRIRLFRHEKNMGKGAALRTAIGHAAAPVIVIQDADMEYDPGEYHLLLGPILADRADVVFGSRFMGSASHRVLYFWHSLGNKFLTTVSNIFTNINLTDMETCYKAFRLEVLRRITVEENRFGFEPEITAKVAKLGVRIYEVGISYYGRTYAEGKKIGWKDGFRALYAIVKYNLFRKSALSVQNKAMISDQA